MDNVLRAVPDNILATLSRRDLLILVKGEQSLRIQLQALSEELEDRILETESKFLNLKNRLFDRSSEKSKLLPPGRLSRSGSSKKKRAHTRRLPSERYPNLDIIEKEVSLKDLPSCRSCGKEMSDSGLYEDSEYLTVIPKKYLIVRQKRKKYRCGGCHADIQVAPSIPRIKAGSAYSDEMILDVSLSKYCDLIPIERYSSIASRQGVRGLPPQSLIEATHNLAEFVTPAVDRLKEEVLSVENLSADETPHRMLEGDNKSHWFLWSFSGEKCCYFECHDTRSGDVASDLLKESSCEVLLTDVYSGYNKAVNATNKVREEEGRDPILKAYCNAHARRKFKESEKAFPKESSSFLTRYRHIYKLESKTKEKPPRKRRSARKKMKRILEKMRRKAMFLQLSCSSRSVLYTALNYFVKNFEGLTLFSSNLGVAIDNNAQERSLRNPVIGRKTWYGTHSKKGAETAAKLFSLVETCKLNGVNPRIYFKELVQALHTSSPPFTPKEFKELKYKKSSDGQY